MREHADCAPLLTEVFAKADTTWKNWWSGAGEFPLDTLRKKPVAFGMYWSDVICSGLHTELSDEIGVTLEPDTPSSTFLTRANVKFKSHPRRLGLNKTSAWELLDTMSIDPALSKHLGIVLTNRYLAELVKRQVKRAEENIMSRILSDTNTIPGIPGAAIDGNVRTAIEEARRDRLIVIAPTLINRIDQFEARVKARLRGAAVLPKVDPVPPLDASMRSRPRR